MGKNTTSQGAIERLLRAEAGTDDSVAGCPDETIVAGYVDNGLSAKALAAFEDHLAGCGECARLVGFLSRTRDLPTRERPPSDLLESAAGSGDRSPERPVVTGPRGRRWLVAAAGLVLATSVVLLNVRKSSPPNEITNTRFVESGQTTLTLDSPVEGSTMPVDAVHIRWEAQSGSLFYEIRIVDGDGDVAWQTRVEETTTSVPADVGLSEGETYYVLVNAWLAGGKKLSSRHVAFRVSAGSSL